MCRTSRLMTVGLSLMMTLPIAPAGATAQGKDNWYASVTIANPTRNDIHYQFRWGDGAWKRYSIPPGATMTHTYDYEYANQNRSPRPCISFDVGGGIADREYSLTANAAPDASAWWGKRYAFEYTQFFNGRYPLDLVER